jgi:hypothetical protein
MPDRLSSNKPSKRQPSHVPPQLETSAQINSSSLWVAFLVAEKQNTDDFLARVEMHALTIPDDTVRQQFAQALFDKPERVARVVEMLQASTRYSETVRRVVLMLAETGVHHNLRSGHNDFDVSTFHEAVSQWLDGIPSKPIKQPDINTLFLYLLFGWQRRLIDEDTAYDLLGKAFRKPKRPGSAQTMPTHSKQSEIEILLAARPVAPAISLLLAQHRIHKTEAKKLAGQVQAQSRENAILAATVESLSKTISDLQCKNSTLNADIESATSRITDLERQVLDTRDGYQYKLDELRGRIFGILQGNIGRWLRTALDASRSDPPWIEAIQERLEDSLAAIDKEMKWLQRSD